jgi:flagellar biosynthesis GTPase FlhF
MAYICDDCGLSFSRQYNLDRHILDRHRENKHPDEEEESTNESEETVTASESESVTASESESESESEEKEESTDKAKELPGISEEIADKAWERHVSTFEDLVEEYTTGQGKNDADAKEAAYKIILPAYRRTFRDEYTNMLLQIREFKKDPTYIAVIKSAKRLREDDDYTPGESLKAAVTKRKHLVNQLVEDQYQDEFPENDE